MLANRAQQLIRRLRLAPHPEGGWYRRVFAERLIVAAGDGRASRPALSCVYFLLAAGQHAHWHRVASAEVWSLLEGGPLALGLFDARKTKFNEKILGTGGTPRGEPLRAVPAGVWQAALPLGEYALVSCAVGPGFDWADFAWLEDHPRELRILEAIAPKQWARLVHAPGGRRH